MVEHHPQCSADIRKALKLTVLLDDGQYGYVFTEQGYDGADPKWSCHVCCRTIVTERAFSMHLNHPLHNSKLLIPQHPKSQFKKFAETKAGGEASPPYVENESSGEEKSEKSPLIDVVPDVVPGEPVPPGMEDMVEGVCQIQAAFDSYTSGPLLGLEYIVELISTEEEGEPRYICLLCEKKGDPRSVMVHVTSQNHYLKYISCFFRTAGNALNMIPRSNDTRRGISIAINKVATEIERHYGRLKPTSAEAETFMSRKYEILRQIDEKQHFRETPTTTFAELVTIDKIRDYNNLPEDALWVDHYATPKKEYQEEREKVGSLEKIKEIDDRKIVSRPVVSESVDTVYIDLRKDEDVIIIADDKTSSAVDVRSLSSVSSISSSGSKFRPRRRGNSRSRSRHRYPKLRSRSRSGSRPRRRYRNRPRSSSRGRFGGSRVHRRSRSRERFRRRSPHFRRGSPLLPYSRHPRSRSRSRERHFRDVSPQRNYKSRRSDSKFRHRENMEPTRDRYSPKRRPDNVGRRENENVKKLKWEKFQRELEKLEDEMGEQLKYFKTRPEKHPKYPEEWKSFWNRRYKELQHTGKDPSVYDFKPEWIIFWDKRMKELHEEEMARKKEELRRNVDLEEWGRNSSLSNDLQDISPPTPDANKDITVNDIKNTWKALTGSDITAPHSTRSPSPWEGNSSSSQIKEHSPTPQLARARREGGSTLNDIVPPIVHCLRMLSVLENQLGSLGPKILEFLSKALALEKTKPSASMTLLQNRDIFLLFETVKEKFRAQLLAGVVMRHLVAPTRAVIKSIDNMLTSNPLNPEVFEPVKVAGVGMVDKVAVAQQIASALVSQGRTDVSQLELEELINAVVGMAQASNANPAQNMSSAAFFSQLNIQNSTGSSHINQILSNMIAKAQQSISNDPASQSYQSMQFSSNDPVSHSYQPSQFPPSDRPPFQTPQFQTNDQPPPSQSFYTSQFPSNDRPPQSYQASSFLSDGRAPPIFPSVQFQTNGPHVPTSTYQDIAPNTVSESFLEAKATMVNSAQSDSSTYLKTMKTSNEMVKQDKPQAEDPDAKLKSRLMRFQELPREEQHKIIALLKELERSQPARVEKLRECVSISLIQGTGQKNEGKRLTNRLSPFSSRSITVNPEPEKNKNLAAIRNKNVDSAGKSYETVRIEDDDDDDDYSYEDVYNAASETLRIKQLEEEGSSQLLDSSGKKTESIIKEQAKQDLAIGSMPGAHHQQYVGPEPPPMVQQSNTVQGNYLNSHSNYNSQYSQGPPQQQYNTLPGQYYPQQNSSNIEQPILNNPPANVFRTEKGFNARPTQNYNSRSEQSYNPRQYNQPGYNAYPNNYNQY